MPFQIRRTFTLHRLPRTAESLLLSFHWDKPGPNLDVIEAAAERQTVFLRTFQIGPQAELAERILNEIASAQVTLLNVDQKLAYDAALRQQRTETEQQAQTAEPHSRESVDPFGAPTQVL